VKAQRGDRNDYAVVFPIAAILIMIILGLLLRSVVAPWYLMISVGLGFAATLGTTVLIFQHAAGQPGLIFLLPIIMYLFVVALGTDYNIADDGLRADYDSGRIGSAARRSVNAQPVSRRRTDGRPIWVCRPPRSW
jgi:uncharacterized membrane protein YdfJ with MMPL/SSD domain